VEGSPSSGNFNTLSIPPKFERARFCAIFSPGLWLGSDLIQARPVHATATRAF